jgi:hypothetical protein
MGILRCAAGTSRIWNPHRESRRYEAMPAQERPIYPARRRFPLGSPIRYTVPARISPAQNLLFWCSISHYSYDKIADHSGGPARVLLETLHRSV